MFEPYEFLLACMALGIVSFAFLFFTARYYPPLRKAWIVYSVMYVLHFVFFAGIWMSLPTTFPVYRSKVEQVDQIESIPEIKSELKEHRAEIERLTNDLHRTKDSFHIFVFVLTLLGPIVYYNLIKYNLEIEKLSGKRMGSFD
jgi:hypothetical protein